MPRTAATEEGDTTETGGMILERIYLFESLVAVMENLLKTFLAIRVSPDLWSCELDDMTKWRTATE